MFLTFVLFVGIAVAGAGFYVLFSGRSQIEDAARDTHLSYARQIASVVSEQPEEDWARPSALAQQLDNLWIFVIRNDSLLWSNVPAGFESAVHLLTLQEILDLNEGETFFATRRGVDAQRMNVGAIIEGAYIIGVVGQESPLHRLARGLRGRMIIGLSAALIMALLGSWVAADRVTRPLRAIGKSAKNITAGNFHTPIRVTTRAAEIQDLAQNLDQMSVSYRDKIDELERLTQLQNEFLGNISHEVRNPIFSISGYLEALGNPNLSESKRRQFSAKGLANLQRLGNLFHNLIEIARLEYREDMISPVRFNLADLIMEIHEPLQAKAAEKHLQLVMDCDEVWVNADRDRMRQVIVNLIENAIVYSDQGTVRLRYQRKQDKVHLEVIDEGRGIDEPHLSRIFERFYRVDPDRSRRSGGSGLGLSIVKQILHAHGESVHVESTPGLGTRFSFELRLADSISASGKEPESVT